MIDRVGLGWRPELAAGILAHLDRIQVVEVLAEDWLALPAREQRALRTLGRSVPVMLHAVSLGMASTAATDRRRLDGLARLVEAAQPEAWSEHLAFVRAGGIEIGHLAAPPRRPATLEGLQRNVAAAARVVGKAPLLENVATLIDPPASSLDETSWLQAAMEATGAPLLLDLHNLYANARNFGFDAACAIRALPPERIGAVHVAGGRWIGRWLDDHLHDVPAPVYRLCEVVAEHAVGPLTVIVERDGNYPGFDRLLEELALVRDALARGRARASRGGIPGHRS